MWRVTKGGIDIDKLLCFYRKQSFKESVRGTLGMFDTVRLEVGDEQDE